MSGLSERLEDWADGLFHRGELFNGTDEEAADLLREAASLIDQQEKALEAADEAVGYMDSALHALSQPFVGYPHTAAVGALEVGLDIYRSARATSTKEDG